MAFARRIKGEYAQYRDGGPWKYRVIGFDYRGDTGLCSVEAADGSRQPCAIDARNRVKINGRWTTKYFH